MNNLPETALPLRDDDQASPTFCEVLSFHRIDLFSEYKRTKSLAFRMGQAFWESYTQLIRQRDRASLSTWKLFIIASDNIRLWSMKTNSMN